MMFYDLSSIQFMSQIEMINKWWLQMVLQISYMTGREYRHE